MGLLDVKTSLVANAGESRFLASKRSAPNRENLLCFHKFSVMKQQKCFKYARYRYVFGKIGKMPNLFCVIFD